MSKKPADDHSICRNRRATFRFEIVEEFECGIILTGSEVKSLRDKSVTLDEAYARLADGEIWLVGCHITPYVFARTEVQEPTRKRKLLLRSSQIRKLRPKVEQKGFTLVPLRMYFNERGIAKIAIALARGKTLGDKRQSLRTRDDRREMDRATKRRK
ncbi:MAG: SsrA-binding protein SmpB [Planctomycetota bacterium]